MRIFLTGATGFIGSRLVPVLLQQGHTVIAVVRDASAVNLPCDVIEANLSDPGSVETLAKGMRNCDTLIHLAAAIPAASNATESDEEMFVANLHSTEHLLTSIPKNISHVILASTLDVYGPPQFLPLTEEHPLLPQSAYAKSKVACEHRAEALCVTRDIPLTILRFTQVYGPGERPIKAIPLFIRMIAEDKAPTLFGDGSDTRDYLYVDDAVQAIMCAVEKQKPGIFNIASGTSHTLKETVEIVIAVSGKDLKPVYEERKKAKIDISFDKTRTLSGLGFQAMTSLKDGLSATYQWYTAHAL
jgi:UDP-glucose 4-epimerase